MNQDEWDELLAIRAEMNSNMMALGVAEQEEFVALLVKSLEGKGDPPIRAVNRTA